MEAAHEQDQAVPLPESPRSHAATEPGGGLLSGETLTTIGAASDQYEISVPGSTYTLRMFTLTRSGTRFDIRFGDRPLRTVTNWDDVMPAARAHATERQEQTGYAFRDGAWTVVVPEDAADTEETSAAHADRLPGPSDEQAEDQTVLFTDDASVAAAEAANGQAGLEVAMADEPEPTAVATDIQAVAPTVKDLPVKAPAQDGPEPADAPSPERAADVMPTDQSALSSDVPEEPEMVTPARAATPETQEQDRFDFWDDVIGDDLVVDGVVYNSKVWRPDGEGGVQHRGEVSADEPASAADGEPATVAVEPPAVAKLTGKLSPDRRAAEPAARPVGLQQPEDPSHTDSTSRTAPAPDVEEEKQVNTFTREAPAAVPPNAAKSEARELRRHPSLPLWTGNNLPAGRWERRGNVLYEPTDGNAIWRVRDRAANTTRPPAETVQPEEPTVTATTPDDVPDIILWQGWEDEPPEFEDVLRAFDEYVPSQQATSAEIQEAVEEQLEILDEAARHAPTHQPERSAHAQQPAATRESADAVNAALEQADQHADVLRDSPEWQRIQTIRGAVGHLWDLFKEKAGGQYWDALREDVRFRGWWKTVAIRAVEAIGRFAYQRAEILRRSTAGEFPSADALMQLSDAALAYSTPPPATRPEPEGGDTEVPSAKDDASVEQATAPDGRPAAPSVRPARRLDEKASLDTQQAAVPGGKAAVSDAREPHASKRTDDPRPYADRYEAVKATNEVHKTFQGWLHTPMGQELVHSDHPRVAAFREAWQRLPEDRLAAGPGPAAGPYGDVAVRAQELVKAAESSGRFAQADMAALQTLAAAAGMHGARLSVTLPGTAAQAPAVQAAAQTQAPRVATPVPAARRGPRLSA
ncbi:hypothetical protein AB0C77_13745 [Streptomyces sp. NPDC048629]|uniref:hypothetical protein n=1 Tax=Streptomyces sp. NPDC048629 TaxID=3154824 RepID=UPI003420B111